MNMYIRPAALASLGAKSICISYLSRAGLEGSGPGGPGELRMRVPSGGAKETCEISKKILVVEQGEGATFSRRRV